MVKLVLATVLVATWLVQCGGDPELNDTDQNGCPVPRTAAASAASKPSTVRVGVTGTLGEAGNYLAQAEGYFGRQGISVQLVNFISPSRMVPALSSGQIEVAAGAVSPSLFSTTQGNQCVKLVAGSARQDPTANGLFLFARRDLVDQGKLNDYSDLRGMRITVVGRDGAGEYAMAKFLEAGGLAPADARISVMAYPGTLVGLANKSVDLALLPESQASSAADKGLGVKWKAVAAVAPGVQSGVLLFGPQFAAQRDLAARWMTAYLQGVRDYDDAFFRNLRRDDVVAQLIKTSPMKDPKLYDEMDYPMIDANGALNMASVQDQVQWFVQSGELHEPADLNQVIDASFARKAVEQLGTYQ
jgi:NitT/TauT family transport system substrate-binding protein